MSKSSKRGETLKAKRQVESAIGWSHIARLSLITLLLMGLVAVSWVVSQNNILPILHVTVEGSFEHANKAVLVEVIKPHTRGSFLSVDVAQISNAGESLPWVKSLQVRRVWPDSLHLIVKEKVPVARWKNKSLVNKDGETFISSNKNVLAALSTLYGPEASQPIMTSRFIAMEEALQQHGLKIKTLVMDNRRAWSIGLTNDILIVLGRAESEERFNRFLRVYLNELKHYQSQIAEMDMRYPNGLSVIWRPGQKPDFNGKV
jgi:cell division protein FtsQ|tara:strand:- start:8340 stop:9119 length:780 start_codon:yes stop_codon:yes gene_type:complete